MLNRYHLSVFSKEVNSGNPCIVYILSEGIAPSRMQSIAAAEAVSETAFIYPDGDSFRLKIFSPRCEMLSCLHATIAASYVLKTEHMAVKLILGDEPIPFSSINENISLKVTPVETVKLFNPIDIRLRQHFALAKCIWCVTTASGKLRLMVQLSSEQAVTDISVQTIGDLAPFLLDIESFFIYALSSEEGSYVGRMFAPSLGIIEDPVNGNSCVALFSILRAQKKSVTALSVRQARECAVNLIFNDEGMFVFADCTLIAKSVIAQEDMA